MRAPASYARARQRGGPLPRSRAPPSRRNGSGSAAGARRCSGRWRAWRRRRIPWRRTPRARHRAGARGYPRGPFGCAGACAWLASPAERSLLSFDNKPGRRSVVPLLPMAAEPFVAPTDRDMLPSERREFVRTHRTCVFGYAPRADGPSMSILSFIPTADRELLISTVCGAAKAKAGVRSGKVSLCILGERWPFAYVQVYCDARIDADPDLVVDVMMAVGGRMSGQSLPDAARPVVQAMAKEEKRIAIRCRPYATFAQPPRHLHRNDQAERITHWITAAMPWDASDDDGARRRP